MMQHIRSVVVSGFSVRVVLSEDLRLSTSIVMDRTPLDAAHFVPFGEPDHIMPIKDTVTLSISVFKDCLADSRREEWEDYLSRNGLWEKDELESVAVYLYEIDSSSWRGSLEYLFSQLDPTQSVSCDHVVQIASDMPMEELVTFSYGEGSQERTHHQFDLDSWDSAVSSPFVLGADGCRRHVIVGDNTVQQERRPIIQSLDDDQEKYKQQQQQPKSLQKSSLSSSSASSWSNSASSSASLVSTTATSSNGGDEPESPRANNSNTEEDDVRPQRRTFLAFLEQQAVKRQTKKQMREMKGSRHAAAAGNGKSATDDKTTVAASANTLPTTTTSQVSEGGVTGGNTKRRRKKKTKASRRVHREISSAIPLIMKRSDCDLVIARGLFKHGVDTAQHVLEVFKHYLKPFGDDDTFSAFVPWNCDCHSARGDDLGMTRDVEHTTKRIYDEVIACLKRENQMFEPAVPIECCRIDYYGGSGEVPVEHNRDPLIGCGDEPVSVISLSLLSPRNYVIERGNSSHSFHIRNADIIIHEGLFFKYFRSGFEQNKARIHSHSSPRLSLTFMPIMNHNCRPVHCATRRPALNPFACEFNPFGA